MIDEIDGAANTGNDASLIGYLVRLCGTVQSVKTDKDSDDVDGSLEGTEGPRPSESTKKKGKGAKPLCRPIVCICNNLFAPALKPLRQVAHIVQLRKPSPVMLSKRLKLICDLEGFKVDNKSLVDLCEMMECDLRSCLHALQVSNMNMSYIASMTT
jgi:chromosome transmission fidelity protein 18